mmetsp:Transcript_26476/g.39680  ORF Transcript_26476/g.39680 Transcript_26476/m.39680 type:complete len:207 (+) Transcript_26476:834-1454(+)
MLGWCTARLRRWRSAWPQRWEGRRNVRWTGRWDRGWHQRWRSAWDQSGLHRWVLRRNVRWTDRWARGWPGGRERRWSWGRGPGWRCCWLGRHSWRHGRSQGWRLAWHRRRRRGWAAEASGLALTRDRSAIVNIRAPFCCAGGRLAWVGRQPGTITGGFGVVVRIRSEGESGAVFAAENARYGAQNKEEAALHDLHCRFLSLLPLDA